MNFIEVRPAEVPLQLLLEADPSESSIESYLPESWCFVAKRGNQIIAACVLKEIHQGIIELFNITVDTKSQSKGVGSDLLQHVIGAARAKNYRRMELGTGTFGYQLTFYQRLGFRVESVIKDHFLNNYPEPLYENGIQHRDMLRLYLDL